MAGLTLITGAAGSGKTERLVAAARQHLSRDLFASLLVLVPTARHADQFRRRLVQGGGVAFGLDVSTLSLFARRHAPGLAPPEVTAELLRRVTMDRIQQGGAARFAPIAATPGLHLLLGRAVGDLVSEAVPPEAFRAAAVRTGNEDLVTLADVYATYRAALDARGWHDSREAALRAAETVRGAAVTVRDGRPAGLTDLPALVLVDGVEFLRAGEVALVAALAARTEVVFALDDASGLRAEWTARRLLEHVPDARREHVDAREGRPHVEAATAADADAQLREVARAIKLRLAEDPSLRPSDFAVTFRQVAPHLALARRVFAEFDLPLDPAAGERLTHRPFGAWVLRLLRLGSHGWQAGRLAGLLRSAFLDRRRWGLQDDTADHVSEVARRNKLWAGRDRLEALPEAMRQRAEQMREADPARGVPDSSGSSGSTGSPGAYADRLDLARATLATVLPALDALLGAGERTPAAHAAAVDAALFGSRGLVRTAVPGYVGLEVDIRALRDALDAFGRVEEVLEEQPVSFERFVDTLEERMDRPTTLLREAGGVLLAPMHTLHGLRFHAIYAGGLGEGEFPAPRRGHALLDRRARERLAEAGLPLPPEARATEDELWRTVATRAEALTSLWRPRLDGSGRPVAASYYFAAGAEVVDVPGEVAPERAASRPELAVALARGWREGERRRPAGLAAWDVVRAAAPVEQARRGWDPAGRYEGGLHRLSDVPDLAWLLAPGAEWSASRLESYRTCPFQFFANYGLHLRQLQEELESADAAIRGLVVHEVLDATLRPLVEERLPLDATNVERVVARMREVAPALWDSAPERYAFGRAALWRYERDTALDRIESLLRAEAATWPPYLDRVAALETKIRVDAPGVEPPMRMFVGIDRLDMGPGVARIVDYKTGRPIRKSHVEEGQRVQLQWYALGARAHYPEVDRVVARYAYLRPDAEPWELDSADPQHAEVLRSAMRVARGVREDVAAGRFPVQPQVETCPTYCAYRHMCRVSHTSRWKDWGPDGPATDDPATHGWDAEGRDAEGRDAEGRDG